MTSYPIPHFEGLAIGLDRIPSEAELFPDDDTIWLGAYGAEIRLVGTRRRYRIELMLSDFADAGGVPISLWTYTKVARENIHSHIISNGQFLITVGTLAFGAELSADSYEAVYR